MTAVTTDYLPHAGATEASLRSLDVIGFVVAIIITLGPLAATALLHS